MAYDAIQKNIGFLPCEVDMSTLTGSLYTYQFCPVWVGPALNISGHKGASVQPYTYTPMAGGSAVTNAGPPLGCLQGPAIQGEAANVCVFGVSKVLSAGAWAVGDPLCPSSDGSKWIKATTGKYAVATALESAIAGDIVEAMFLPRGVQ